MRGICLVSLCRGAGAAALCGAVLLLASCGSESEQPKDAAVKPPAPGSAAAPIPIPPEQYKPGEKPKRPTLQETAQKDIEQNEEVVAAAESGKDVSGYLIGLGNMYGKKMGNWEKAAENYLRVIDEYPNISGIGNIYAELITCYKQLGDQDRLNKLYLRMINTFPEDSSEYLLAKQGLQG